LQHDHGDFYKGPSFQFYQGDFVANTMHLTNEYAGAYVYLLCHSWEHWGIENDPEDIRMVGRIEKAHYARVWSKLGRLWVPHPSCALCLVNKRQEEVREKTRLFVERQAERGRASSAVRWKTKPEVAQLTRSERLAAARALATHTASEWAFLKALCDNKCVFCGIHEGDLIGGTICKDHIVPISAGGSDGIENLQPACRECNAKKGPDQTNKLPKQALKWLRNGCKMPAAEAFNALPNALPAPNSPDSRLRIPSKDSLRSSGDESKKTTVSDEDLAAYLILDAVYPVVLERHPDLGMSRDKWRKSNKAAALDFGEQGKTPEQVVMVLERAYGEHSKFYGGIVMLDKLALHWAALVGKKRPEIIARPSQDPVSEDLPPEERRENLKRLGSMFGGVAKTVPA
jgi:uncharacterized protein YdaU (DUF1376 family)